MSQQPVINYSLGETTRRKNQQKEFSLESTSWAKTTAGIEHIKPVEVKPEEPKKNYTIVHFLGDCLNVVLTAQEIVYKHDVRD